MSILCLVIHILCVYALQLLSVFFCFFLRQGLAFFGEDRLATLRETKVHKKSCVPFTGNPRVANLAFRLRLADFDPVFLQNNCYRGLIPLNSSR